MKHPTICWVSILFAAVFALGLRAGRLEQRPMHGDEAVHAYKFGELLEARCTSGYRYDPDEYHGPTLNYITLVSAWLSGISTYENLNEFALRIVPVVFGTLLVLLLVAVADGLGRPAAVVAAIATAISPAFVFYSRYYIHEVLLVCFTFGVIISGYRYVKSPDGSSGWAVLAGVCLGLCHATKETCVIAFGAMILAVLLTGFLSRVQDGRIRSEPRCPLGLVRPLHILIGLVVAVVVSALFHSSFFGNPDGVIDSVRTYANYLNRASQSSIHIHRWYYYLHMLVYWKFGPGPVWSEVFIVILAAVGFIAVMMNKGPTGADSGFLRFIAFYTLIMTVAYSAIPYKTPWCMLGFLHGMILLAGVGAVVVMRLAPGTLARVITVLLLSAGGVFLVWQACLCNYKFFADTRNPYVYAHTHPDVVEVAERIDEISEVHPAGDGMFIQVIYPGNFWPLPWYLRRFSNVGWFSGVDEQAPLAPVIVFSAAIDQDLRKKLSELNVTYVPLFNAYKQLRPRIFLRGLVAKDLWDRYEAHQAELVISQSKKAKR
jgi:uncharacterized protein (TIGR03663 family)